MAESITVVCRCRPFSLREKEAGHEDIIQYNDKNLQQISLRNPNKQDEMGGDAAKTFTFDGVFRQGTAQAIVYDSSARVIVDAALNGFNGTVFVYGTHLKCI